jgi:K(+)-stimulated pyrophosphate-energized sodium pump
MFSESIAWLGIGGALLALVFAIILALRVLRSEDGSERMIEIAQALRKGVSAYIREQYLGVAVLFLMVSLAMLAFVYFGRLHVFIPAAFFAGGFFSAFAGCVGMGIATHASSRMAQAATTNLNRALQIAFSGGGVLGFVVTGLGTLFASACFFALLYYFNLRRFSLLESARAFMRSSRGLGEVFSQRRLT